MLFFWKLNHSTYSFGPLDNGFSSIGQLRDICSMLFQNSLDMNKSEGNYHSDLAYHKDEAIETLVNSVWYVVIG